MRLLIMIGLAGAVGALSRYGISAGLSRIAGSAFPWGTLAVNVVGCLIIGFVMHVSLTTNAIPHQWRVAITVGFLGALTTFSSFSYETIQLIEKSAYLAAMGNVGLNMVLGLCATVAGLAIGRLITGGA